jgi:hypothetical protein
MDVVARSIAHDLRLLQKRLKASWPHVECAGTARDLAKEIDDLADDIQLAAEAAEEAYLKQPLER